MDYLVDAGKIERTRSSSARDAALMIVAMLGNDAVFPIDVYTESTGERVTFTEDRNAGKAA